MFQEFHIDLHLWNIFRKEKKINAVRAHEIKIK